VEVSPGQSIADALCSGVTTIVLRGGTHFLTEPIVIGPTHSGVTIEAKPGEQPIISGGKRIDGWHATKLNSRACWAAEVADVRNGKWFFRELWVNGRRATRARRPNRGAYFRVKESPDAGPDWGVGQTRFRFEGSDVPAGPFAYGAEAVLMHRWMESRLPINSVDVDQHLISFLRHTHIRQEAEDPYWLDQAGDWLCMRSGIATHRRAGHLQNIEMHS